jgi:hypothetical protein
MNASMTISINKPPTTWTYFAGVRKIHNPSSQALEQVAQALSSVHHDKLCQPTQSSKNNTQPLDILPVQIAAKHDGRIYHEGFR